MDQGPIAMQLFLILCTNLAAAGAEPVVPPAPTP
jgi:hypothetical protein